jgi:hypothetical protein
MVMNVSGYVKTASTTRDTITIDHDLVNNGHSAFRHINQLFVCAQTFELLAPVNPKHFS